MTKQNSRTKKGKKKLAPDQISVDYLPPPEPAVFPVRGGKRAPGKYDEAPTTEKIKASIRRK